MNAVARTKPGAATLLTGQGEGLQEPQVVLAHQRYGRGKALAFTVQDSWQWQMHAEIPLEDRTHESLWQQLLRWLVADVPGQVDVELPEDRVSPGRPVQIRALVKDDTYLEVNDADVVAIVRDPAGDEREYPMECRARRRVCRPLPDSDAGLLRDHGRGDPGRDAHGTRPDLGAGRACGCRVLRRREAHLPPRASRRRDRRPLLHTRHGIRVA